jgi:hypothetical protein
MSAADLWARLADDNLVEGEMPPGDHAASPWYVRVMLGIAGWIGASFLLLFVGAAFAFIMDSAAYAAFAGAACCAAAWALFRKFDGNDFAEQFALVISLVGQALIVVGIGQYLKIEDAGFYLAIAATQAVLALAVPNFLHRVLTTSGAAVALALAVNQLSLHGLAAPLLCAGLAFVWLEPRRWAASGNIWRPIGYGLVLALLLVETFRLFGAELLFGMASKERGWFALHGPFLGRVLTAAILVGTAILLTRREALAPSGRTALLALGVALLLGLVSLNAPGLASALLILLLGFSAGSRILVAIGILSLLGFATHFYYSLHATLLEKSGLLALMGLCLLTAHFVLRRASLGQAAAEAGHA